MICVSIGRGRHRHMIAEHKYLASQGVHLVELRIDYIQGRPNLKRLLTERPTPVVVTVRRECDGGKFSGTEQDREILLRSAIVEGVEYVDLEDGVAAETPRFGKTKRIVSFHNFEETPENLDEIYNRLASQDADVVKICTLARCQQDNARMLQLVAEKNAGNGPNLVGFCMGEIGIPSRILCGSYGAPFTYACSDSEQVLAPGQLAYREMVDLYRYDNITQETELFGVVADPVGHSLSPLIHNTAFAKLGMDKVYLPFRVNSEELPWFIKSFKGLCGLSVTIPHKERIIPLLDEVDESVKMVGACNTVVWRAGKSKGSNTDYSAALDSILTAEGEYGDLALPSTGNSDRPLLGRTALVLGAGGVGKAVAVGLANKGAEVILTDVDAPRAEQLAKKIAVRTVDWERRTYEPCHILANCTPVGMYPKVDETPYDASFLRGSAVVFDAVYNPEETLLLKQSQKQGCVLVSGLKMFIRQAAHQFKLFTGSDAPEEEMRAVVKKALKPRW